MKVAYDFLCLDERDSPNIKELSGKTREQIKNNTNKRYFGLCGVIIPGALYPQLNIDGRTIQEKLLGKGKYQPFHYVEILNCKGSWAWIGKDQNKYRSTKDLLNHFCSKNKYTIIGSFVDKTQIALTYGKYVNKKLREINRIRPNLARPSTPRTVNLYIIALKVILRKYYNFLIKRKKKGLIIAEARGEKEDRLLLDAFYTFQKSGAGYLSGKQIRESITDLLIVRKNQNHIGCQLADLITYPTYDYFVPDHNTRSDHFIKRGSIKNKVHIIDIFPKKQKRS